MEQNTEVIPLTRRQKRDLLLERNYYAELNRTIHELLTNSRIQTNYQLPQRPRSVLTAILKRKKKLEYNQNVNNVHNFLMSKLIYADEEPSEINHNDTPSQKISKLLRQANRNRSLRLYAEAGHILHSAKYSGQGDYSQISNDMGFSISYLNRLIQIFEICSNYPKFLLLNIGATPFSRYIPIIPDLMRNPRFRAFWLDQEQAESSLDSGLESEQQQQEMHK